MPHRILLALLLALLFSPTLPAQTLAGARNEDQAVLIQLGYGPFTTAGDLADRFGSGFHLDGAVTFLAKDSNWEFGLRAVFGFGNDVKEDVVSGLRTREGFVIGNQRALADVQLRHRQLFLGPVVGYTVPLGENRRAGLHLKTAVGYFYSKIGFQDDPVQAVVQLSEELQPGYDRLAGGPALHQFVGFQQLSQNRRINWYVGGEALVGFTRNQRSFDYNAAQPLPTDGRIDVALGAKIGLILPLYSGEGREIFYR